VALLPASTAIPSEDLLLTLSTKLLQDNDGKMEGLPQEIEIDMPFLRRNLKRTRSKQRAASEHENSNNPNLYARQSPRLPFLLRSTRTRIDRQAVDNVKEPRKDLFCVFYEWFSHVQRNSAGGKPAIMTTKKADVQCFRCPICDRLETGKVG